MRVLFATPFRSFFLVGALMATFWVPGWIAVLYGKVTVTSDLGPVGWHAHEMLFGYTGAVLAGFLLTAARNWTKRPTVSGLPLALLVLLWCGGRVVALRSAELPEVLAPALDAGFFALVAVALARPIIGARSKRNAAFPLLMLGMAAADMAMHLAVSGELDPAWMARGQRLAIDIVAIVIILFAGRIVPMFTRNALAGFASRPKGLLDWTGLGLVWAVASFNLLLFDHAAAHGVAIAAGVVNLARLWGWGGSRTVGKPILWVLHVAWLMVCAGLIASGLAGLTAALPASAATHIFTVGGLGLFTLGMMARVSLGHTGRKLHVPRVVAIGFALMVVAAFVRVVPAVVAPEHYAIALKIAAAIWGAAFGVFTARYLAVFIGPRADGKPG